MSSSKTVTVQDYVDLSDADQDAYECQRCKSVFQEKFERGECPVCDTRDSMHSVSEYAKELVPVDHGKRIYGIDRVVRL